MEREYFSQPALWCTGPLEWQPSDIRLLVVVAMPISTRCGCSTSESAMTDTASL
jgi:hypothetical protein